MTTLFDAELIAGALRATLEAHAKAGRAAHANGILDACAVLSRRMKQDDPDFDRARFLRACGMPEASMNLYE